MRQKDFFQKLKDELRGHPFRDRFLEELEDHAEDLGEENLNNCDWGKRMGEPLSVKENFMKIMHPFGKLFFVMEGLFYGLLLIPITLVYFTYIKWTMTEAPITLIRMVFAIVIVIFLSTALQFLAFKRLSKIQPRISYEKLKWFSLILAPNILILFILLFFKNYDAYNYLHTSKKILSFLAYLGLTGISLFFAYVFKKRQTLSKNKIEKQAVLKFLKYTVIIYFGLAIILKTLFTYFDAEIENASLILIFKILSIFSPVIWLEYLFIFFWSAIGNSLFPTPNIFAGFYSLIVFLLFLSFQSIWVIIKEKKYMSFRAIIVIYVLSLFFIDSTPFDKEPDFMVPTTNLSKTIEKNQVGIFYPILKYFNQDEGTFFKYEVGFKQSSEENGFVIKNNIGNYIYLPYKTIESPKLSLVYDTNEASVPAGVNLPNYYECDRKDLDNCNINDFVNRYVTQNGEMVMDAAFSQDGKWALIVFPGGAYDPQNVYLVRLK